jgi:hypothetical protein
MTDPIPHPVVASYNDQDLVYVDPDSKTVVGKVEWSKNERPKSMPYKATGVTADAATSRKPFFRKYFPFGTYRSMKKVFRLQGKTKDPEPNRTLDEVLPRALNEAYWEWDSAVAKNTPVDQG